MTVFVVEIWVNQGINKNIFMTVFVVEIWVNQGINKNIFMTVFVVEIWVNQGINKNIFMTVFVVVVLSCDIYEEKSARELNAMINGFVKMVEILNKLKRSQTRRSKVSVWR